MSLEHIFYSLKRLGNFFSGQALRVFFFFFSSERRTKLCSLTFSGAEKGALFSYFLWRRERSKETSTLTKPSPIWESRPASGVWYGSQSLCPYGVSHGLFIGWRMEGGGMFIGCARGEPWSFIGWRIEGAMSVYRLARHN